MRVVCPTFNGHLSTKSIAGWALYSQSLIDTKTPSQVGHRCQGDQQRVARRGGHWRWVHGAELDRVLRRAAEGQGHGEGLHGESEGGCFTLKVEVLMVCLLVRLRSLTLDEGANHQTLPPCTLILSSLSVQSFAYHPADREELHRGRRQGVFGRGAGEASQGIGESKSFAVADFVPLLRSPFRLFLSPD